jgi:hypothetical protein
MPLACRACRVQMAADVSGCAVCAPMRSQLVSTDEDEETVPSLAGAAAESVRFLRGRQRYLARELAGSPGDSKLAKLANETANGMTKLLEAARKLQNDGAKAVASMSFTERARLFVGWYASLPPPFRSGLRRQMEDFEADVAKPVAPPTQPLMLPPVPA